MSATIRPASLSQELVQRLTNPSKEDLNTLYLIGGYFLAILILWNLPVLKHILYPFKLITVAFHEFGHASVGLCTGAKIKSINVDPDQGGLTTLQGGIAFLVLPAGYLGSAFIGALLLFCGFNTLASKVVTALVCIALLLVLRYATTWFTRILTLLFIAGLVITWVFTPDGIGLRYAVLFIGTMSACYSVWDIIEDLVVRKVNSSDATIFAKRYGCLPQFWGFFWFVISLIFAGVGIVAGLLAW